MKSFTQFVNETSDNPDDHEPLTIEWASAYRANHKVPDGWYVHGRRDRHLSNTHIIQLTQDWSVAEQYAASNGIAYMIGPKRSSTVVDFGRNSNLLKRVAEMYVKDYDDDRLSPSQEFSLDEMDYDEKVEDVMSSLTPRDIVSSAEFYDTPAVEWLYETLFDVVGDDVDMIVFGDSGVAFNPDNLHTIPTDDDLVDRMLDF